jgi:hypothetical protein
MRNLTLTKEAILGGPLDEERHALFLMVARLDVEDHYQDDKYIRPLLKKRLQEIEEKRIRLEPAQSDAGEYADLIAAVEEENRRLNSPAEDGSSQ